MKISPKELARSFNKSGIKVLANTKSLKVDTSGAGCKVYTKDRKTGKEELIECDIVLFAATATPLKHGIEELGVATDRGFNKSRWIGRTNISRYLCHW